MCYVQPAEAPAPAPPAPAPFKPAPAPAPVVPKPAPVAAKKDAPKQQQQQKPGKRRGPLPMWFAQVLLLGAFGGAVYAGTKFSAEISAATTAAGAKAVEALTALEKLVNKKEQSA